MGTLQGTSQRRLTPPEALLKYKITERVRKCAVCNSNAYYWYEVRGYLCAPHLLDLVNIGEVEWKWADWEEVWRRTGITLEKNKNGKKSV